VDPVCALKNSSDQHCDGNVLTHHSVQDLAPEPSVEARSEVPAPSFYGKPPVELDAPPTVFQPGGGDSSEVILIQDPEPEEDVDVIPVAVLDGQKHQVPSQV
jgi:hypothetical protein